MLPECGTVCARTVVGFAEGGGQRLKKPTRFLRKGDWNATIACLCLRDGAGGRSRCGARRAAWPGRCGRRRPTGDVASGGPDGTPSGTDAASADAVPPAAGTATNAGTAADATAAPDATAAQHGWHAGAAAKFPAAQHGRRSQYVAAFTAERWDSTGPRHAAAARHGITAARTGHDAAGRHARPGGRWHEPASAAAWWRTGRSQSARWSSWWAEWRRSESAWRWFCQSSGGRLSPAWSASRWDRRGAASWWHRPRRCRDASWHGGWSRQPSRSVNAAPRSAKPRRHAHHQALSSAGARRWWVGRRRTEPPDNLARPGWSRHWRWNRWWKSSWLRWRQPAHNAPRSGWPWRWWWTR